MSEKDKEEPIIIRKKVSGGEDDHHGGVWKLAFADFMTAMMAFFLVMWLINSTSKETKAVIVQYFNPVQLTDSTPAVKGLSDPGLTQPPASHAKQETKDNTKKSPMDVTEEDLHTDPLQALNQIVNNESKHPSRSSNDPDRFSDPFERADQRAGSVRQKLSDATSSAQTEDYTHTDHESAALTMRHEIEKIVRQESRNPHEQPTVEVKAVDGGVLISLTDDANFNMFGVGSIEPKPQLIRILGQIGKILASRPGEIEIRGYTDARSYAGRNYDNWRLSSDRATIVNYTLVRGGLPPSRVEKVVGYADRHLKNSKEPLSPLNRRIEIFLRPEK